MNTETHNIEKLQQMDFENTSNAVLIRELHQAVQRGYASCVKMLLDHNPQLLNDNLLILAVQHQKPECLKIILPHADKNAPFHEAICEAVRYGCHQCVQILIPYSNLKKFGSEALRLAVEKQHLECVKLLIPHSDVITNNSWPLTWACYQNNQELFDLLYPHSEPRKVLERLMQDNINTDMLTQRIKADQEKHTIGRAVSFINTPSTKRKI